MITPLLLALVGQALGCTPNGDLSLLHGEDLPVDAGGVIRTQALVIEELTVTGPNGPLLDVALAEVCYESDGIFGYCRTWFRPEQGWTPGATFEVWIQYRDGPHVGEYSWELSAAEDGRQVVTVSATPDISVDTVGTCDGGLSSNCAHDCPMDYELTVTPAEVDPDALSYLLIERRDGYSRVADVPMSEEPFAFAPTAPEVPDNCFRVRQVDGAQNYSDWSPWRCPEGEASKPESGACGGCETSAGNRAGSALTLLLGVIHLLLTRSRVGRSPRS